MLLRDELGVIYDEASFRSLFAIRGRPTEAPWRLAMVRVTQFAERLSDRKAADAVWGCLLSATLRASWNRSNLCADRRTHRGPSNFMACARGVGDHTVTVAAMREQHDLPRHDHRLGTALREPSLRAALLALGIGVIWVALSRWRRRRPADLW